VKASFLEAFKPRLRRYRRRRRIGLSLFTAFMLGGFLVSMTGAAPWLGAWTFVLLTACWLGACVALIFGQRPRCPACGRRLIPAVGGFCPQCGSDQFQKSSNRWRLFSERIGFCPACRSTLGEESGDGRRTYRVRGCTHCGVLLDENGF
jgi:RNA polymerase subunit RPABC4/transcription elongation factor Spt4